MNGGVWPQNCTLGPGNLFLVDPMFCSDGLHLHSSSPLVHAGEGGTYIGAYGVGCGVASVQPGEVAGIPRVRFSEPYPNPVSGTVRLQFELATAAEEVALDVFDVLGRHIATPFHGVRLAGQHVVDWDIRHEDGQPLQAGVYYVRLSANGLLTTRKMIVVR